MRLPYASTLMPTMFYAASGAAYALANLVLARRLPERDYAVFTLVLAMMALGPSLAAAGLDGVAVRGALRFVPGIAVRVWLAAGLIALALGGASTSYGVGHRGAALIAVAATAGGATAVAAAEFQRRHQFAVSLTLLHTPNYALLIAVLLLTASGLNEAWLPLVGMTVGSMGAACWAWSRLLRQPPEVRGSAAVPWRDAFALAATNASGSVMTQLDRLIIPYLLPLGDLATYGALSSVAGSIFRVVQRGVGYGLVPRLRAAVSVGDRRRLVAGEARLVTAVALVGSLVIWSAMPIVEHWLLADKYRFSGGLVLATLVAGCAKLLQALGRAAVTALAEPKELELVNLSGWASLAIAVLAAAIGARWGLTGVIYGVALGWLCRALATLAIMYRHLRPVGEPARP